MAIRLERDETRLALEAWADVSGFGGSPVQALQRGIGWLRLLWERGLDDLPLDLVMDLGHLLIEGRAFRFASDERMNRWPPEQLSWRLEYEDRVLGRWAIDPTVNEAQQIVARRPEGARDIAVVHALSLALGRPTAGREATDDIEAFAGNSAVLKSIGANAPTFVEQLAAVIDGSDPVVDETWTDWARRQRQRVVSGLQGHLLDRQALWELYHIDRLPSASTRMALRLLRATTDAIPALTPGWGAELRRRARQVATDEVTDDDFPAGGFEGLSRRGRFENLVRSEMAYIGETPAGDRPDPRAPDLFDVRFAQGELTFYTRDESPLYNLRVIWTAVFDRPGDLRHKHPELAAQTLILAEAVALRVQADLVEIMGPAGSETTFEWSGETSDVRVEEGGLFALLLADEIALHRVRIPASASLLASATNHRVVFSPRARPKAETDTSLWLRVDGPEWEDGDQRFDLRQASGTRNLVDRVLAYLLGIRGPQSS